MRKKFISVILVIFLSGVLGVFVGKKSLEFDKKAYAEDSKAKASTVAGTQTTKGEQVLAGKDKAAGDILLCTEVGNVGIRTSTPGEVFTIGDDKFRVDLTGNLVKINNVTYSWPGSQGGAGKALINDGAGALTWATPTGSVVWGGITGTLSDQTDLNSALGAKEATANKDATDGYAGLTLYKINFKNVANTFTSFFTNTNTAARTYTAVDRNATIGNNLNNYSTADQSVAAATSALITGSLIAVPAGKVQIGTTFKWIFTVSKTAAGTVLSTFYIRVGTAGTVADAIVATLATTAGTAVVDKGMGTIIFTVRGPLTSACLGAAHLQLTHNLSTTGLINVPANNIDVSPTTAFNATTADLKVSLSVTTGASTVFTFQQVIAEVINL